MKTSEENQSKEDGSCLIALIFWSVVLIGVMFGIILFQPKIRTPHSEVKGIYGKQIIRSENLPNKVVFYFQDGTYLEIDGNKGVKLKGNSLQEQR